MVSFVRLGAGGKLGEVAQGVSGGSSKENLLLCFFLSFFLWFVRLSMKASGSLQVYLFYPH